jgi:protocatechuate 3,4-dioxygenase beta subunit
MDLGPFYPVRKPAGQGADLTHGGRAKGELLDLRGRVLTPDGRPVAGARIEFWQANAAGRYRHKGDQHNAPLDPNFNGYAVETADAAGRFHFLTVRPGAYPAGDFMRAAHIHFDVSGRYDRLVTQMYFRGDKWLDQDKVLAMDMFLYGGRRPDDIFGQMAPSPTSKGPTSCRWDIVLADG